jgi:hypothetical protein
MRFTVRKAAKGWLVWDTVTRRVADLDDRPAIGVSEETAKLTAEMLNSQDKMAEGTVREDL